MKILVIDFEHAGLGLNFAIRCHDAKHDVAYWVPKLSTGKPCPVGDGLIRKIPDWKKAMDWADLIVMTDNCAYHNETEPYFKKGYPIIGANKESAELELDRELGQEICKQAGIKTIPYEVFTNYDKAIKYVKETKKPYVAKPWGGTSDKSLTYVSKTPADMVFNLQQWKAAGLKGSFILQEKIEGVEIAVGGWFGPGGWNRYKNENFEEKKLMNEGLDCNTGEAGTTMHYTKKSALFDAVLKPVTNYLHKINYVGYVDQNCIVLKDGTPMPLEFTMRFGWPHFNIAMALHEGDPAQFLLDLINGSDTLECSEDAAVGVVMAHGSYPFKGPEKLGYPVTGITPKNYDQVHLQSVMKGIAPVMDGDEVRDEMTMVSAGNYLLVTTGTGKTVEEARDNVYDVTWDIDIPSNRKFRTDIGCRLEDDLKELHKHGFAKGLEYK
jgi:phosphoribosylamine--glycine ligase